MLARLRFFFAAALLAGPAISQGDLAGALEELPMTADWEQLCEIVDCHQFPVGYNTYAFGPAVYYFPTMATMTVKPPDVLAGGVKAGRFYETDSDGNLRRSVSVSGSTIVARCCHHLLTFYGLAEAMPTFRSVDGNRMPSAWTIISSFDRPTIKATTRQRLGYGSKSVPSIRDLIAEDQPSYNEDFWLLGFGEPSERGIRFFEVLSKRPLLNGHHVLAGCEWTCTFRTLRLEETGDETRPHVILREMLLTGENMFFCSPAELEDGCDPAPEIFDQVPVMLGLIEDMFDAAAESPAGKK